MENLDFLWECIEGLEYGWNRVNSNTPIVLLVLVAMVYLWKSKDKRIKEYLVYPEIVFFCIMLNPVVEWILLEKLGFESRIHRFFWVIPIPFLIAYVILELCRMIKGKRIFFLCFVLLLCAGMGRSVYQEEHYRTENIYKVENEVLELSQKMQELTEETFKVYINEVHPNYTIRQLDASFLLIHSPRALEDAMTNSGLKELCGVENADFQHIFAGYFYGHYPVDMERLKQGLGAYELDYLILNYKETELESLGWIEYLDKTDHFYIYKVLYE